MKILHLMVFIVFTCTVRSLSHFMHCSAHAWRCCNSLANILLLQYLHSGLPWPSKSLLFRKAQGSAACRFCTTPGREEVERRRSQSRGSKKPVSLRVTARDGGNVGIAGAQFRSSSALIGTGFLLPRLWLLRRSTSSLPGVVQNRYVCPAK